MSKSHQRTWAIANFGGGVTAYCTLIAASASMPRWAVFVVAFLSAGFLSLAIIQFRWAGKAPFPIGRLPRAMAVHGIIWLGTLTTAWMVLPQPAAAHIHITRIDVSVPDAALGRAAAKVSFTNNGEAPAKLRSAGRMAWYIDQGDVRQRWAFEEGLFSDEPTLGTDALTMEIPFGTDRSITLTSSPWLEGAVKAFQDGKGTVYAAGTIFYEAGDELCRTRYCMYVERDGSGKFCLRHNEEPKCR